MTRVILVLATFCVAAYAARSRWPAPRLDGRIVGGKDANIEDYPYQLSLEKYGSHSCGASIISSQWAMTAAHCVSSSTSNPGVVTLRAGTSTRGKGGSVHIAVEIIVHPNYDSWTIDFDYALIRVDVLFNIGQPGVQVVALTDDEPQAGDLCVVSGWGTLSSGGYLPTQLQKVEVPIVGRNVCEEQYKNYDITARMICAGVIEGGKDACQGDSGGPLVANGRLVGIVSWGVGCGKPDYAGVYTNIAAQRDWIKTVTGI